MAERFIFCCLPRDRSLLQDLDFRAGVPEEVCAPGTFKVTHRVSLKH